MVAPVFVLWTVTAAGPSASALRSPTCRAKGTTAEDRFPQLPE